MNRYESAKAIYQAGLERVRTKKPPKNQKFLPGTFVDIDKEMPDFMSHFESAKPAMVQCTYAHAYGGNDVESYSLLIRYAHDRWSEVSWYYESQLTAITDADRINQYKKEVELLEEEKE